MIWDAIVVGAGPAGSVVAQQLAEAGRSVLLVEREHFPRFHIGESLTVSAGDLIREWGLVEEMTRLDFPEKTGVKVIGRSARSEFYVPVLRPTWQVRRDTFDELLLNRAVEQGVTLRWGSVRRILRDGDRVVGVGIAGLGPDATDIDEVHGRVVIDATGGHALMSTQKIAGPRVLGAFGHQIASFSQFEHAARDPGAMGDNTFIFYGSRFHWAWFIPLSSTRTSVGVVLPAATFKSVGDSPEAVYEWGVQHVNPELHRRVDGRERVEPVRVVRNYSYTIDPFVGPGWLCVGDAHGFHDPIFSFGVSFAMTEARRAARAVNEALDGAGPDGIPADDGPFAAYSAFATSGQHAALDLIQYFWRFPAFFSYQTRGANRAHMVRLLGGDCFEADDNPILQMMRQSLAEVG